MVQCQEPGVLCKPLSSDLPFIVGFEVVTLSHLEGMRSAWYYLDNVHVHLSETVSRELLLVEMEYDVNQKEEMSSDTEFKWALLWAHPEL